MEDILLIGGGKYCKSVIDTITQGDLFIKEVLSMFQDKERLIVNHYRIARKSIVTKSNTRKREVFSENNLAVKRPGNGISPMRWDKMIKDIAKRNYEEDELIEG
ncbi:hypothetical protein GM661_06745 [Iocasia frigidifontis]|uniref:AFP-like domain-containing protein n=1 Tax=Iocasia fonsfrigidae TaxID=2682810 RepID=A0A8A7KHU8_9FIRM|nr:hypothetical protein [Iocasia fonsfrigidae]QTL97704.1 hypothetical protein GM661_06745 [Iocasia fonsfrigidae]